MVNRFERFSLLLFEILRYWHKLTAEEMKKYGLKGAHSIYLLTMLRYPDGITATQICECCVKDKADVSRMMTLLEKKGLVKKEGIHQNLYKGVFKLTEEGRKAALFVSQRASLAVDIAGKDLTDEQRKVLYEALEQIASNLRKLNKEGLPE
ncbi:MarR family transcriptional regulator [uncultured Traorella sp.]|uniref:MarR family winged helix-turn-helix transcriptional regulator n=1 Tax=uncultured Traorella sp. TaxID=1929048 RepID=UPI0025E90EB7|nr:MarR family transcriptional regulator [uncultured Traorella sp.]